ncbi:MAG: Crp/Fnr family transcriptional regulator [Betaproteobacteria bacterium]|nr:Crp/Fnr family transcriptional regulator [Betaproteobacteria bacterium]
MSKNHSPEQNLLLAVLPRAERTRVFPHLELVPMVPGQALYDTGGKLPYVYFPTTAVVSLLYVMIDGRTAELAVVGSEGVVGISVFMGGESTPSRAVVQTAGYGYRLQTELLKLEFTAPGAMLQMLLRYTQALIAQMAQTADCNRRHTLDQQLCRWLLLSLDRLPSNEFVMTQDLMAHMLGVGREAATEAAGRLHAAGLIRHSRSHIKVVDRTGVEARACECYQVVRRETDHLLPESVLH